MALPGKFASGGAIAGGLLDAVAALLGEPEPDVSLDCPLAACSAGSARAMVVGESAAGASPALGGAREKGTFCGEEPGVSPPEVPLCEALPLVEEVCSIASEDVAFTVPTAATSVFFASLPAGAAAFAPGAGWAGAREKAASEYVV